MATALRRSRSCAWMNPRCGSHADTVDAGLAVVAGAAGGHPGGICRGGSREALLVHADRLAIDPGHSCDLALGPTGLQQRPYRRLQVRLQDVHSTAPWSV